MQKWSSVTAPPKPKNRYYLKNKCDPVIGEKFLSNSPLFDVPSTQHEETKHETILEDRSDESEYDYQMLNAKSRTLNTKTLEMMISENAHKQTHKRKASDPHVQLHG